MLEYTQQHFEFAGLDGFTEQYTIPGYIFKYLSSVPKFHATTNRKEIEGFHSLFFKWVAIIEF